MSKNNHTHDRSGRTTRMLSHALELSKQGKSVCIIAKDKSQWRDFLAKISISGYSNMHGDIVVKSFEEDAAAVDWSTLKLKYDPKVVVLIDHYVLECIIPKLEEMMNRYNLKEEKGSKCPNDTNNDGDCHLCFKNPSGCFWKQGTP